MDISHPFDAIVFYEKAVFHGSKETRTLGLMDRIDVALSALKASPAPIMLATTKSKHAMGETLNEFGLVDVFTHAGELQIIEAHKHENPAVAALPNQSPLYYRPLIDKGFSQNQCLAVAASIEDVRSAKDTGISNIIGFYGSPDIPFGETASHQQWLTEKGAIRTMVGYFELSETMWGMRPHQTAVWQPMKAGCC